LAQVVVAQAQREFKVVAAVVISHVQRLEGFAFLQAFQQLLSVSVGVLCDPTGGDEDGERMSAELIGDLQGDRVRRLWHVLAQQIGALLG
jgi:hypothetical protein